MNALACPSPFVPPTSVEIERGEPAEVAVENALRKARAARVAGAPEMVLGVDTLVALDARIYGKPPNEAGGARDVEGARWRDAHGVQRRCAIAGDREQVALARTEVAFRDLGEELIEWYLASGEWRGRAGGYAIQGVGAILASEIHGDYENVVGLPLATLLDLCPEFLQAHTLAAP